MLRDADRALREGSDSELRSAPQLLTPEEIALAARRFDPLAVSLIGQSADRTGRAIATLASALNPGVVVAGGAISSAGDAFLVPFRRRFHALARPLASRDVVITRSQGDTNEPIHGGNALVVEQLFERTFIDWFAAGPPSPPDNMSQSQGGAHNAGPKVAA